MCKAEKGIPNKGHAERKQPAPKERLAQADAAEQMEGMVAVIPEGRVQGFGKKDADGEFDERGREHDEEIIKKIKKGSCACFWKGRKVRAVLKKRAEPSAVRCT